MNQAVPASSLAFFRIAFGLLMAFSALRFVLKGWVQDLYVKPDFYFTYYGFAFVKPLPEWAMYALFALIFASALMVAAGLFYRASIITFFLSFGYVELIDKATYLNHYYFVSLMAFLMIFLPMHKAWSLDAVRKARPKQSYVPAWALWAVKLQIAIVYFFGGIAKLKPEWLLEAQPLKIWLSASAGIPYIGWLLALPLMAYVFAWAGMLFDLGVPFLLLHKKTRIWAYMAIIFFHVMTAELFYIGMFPYIMMVCTLVFFPASLHEKWLNTLKNIFLSGQGKVLTHKNGAVALINNATHKRTFAPVLAGIILLFFLFQAVMPFRYLLYPNRLCWAEEGYRYSWNIMLIEKNASTEFTVTDPATKRSWLVSPEEYLTRFQAKQMSSQPDMILQFAHYIGKKYEQETGNKVEVRAESYASLNGHASRMLIDPDTDLMQEQDALTAKKWIMPYEQDPQNFALDGR